MYSYILGVGDCMLLRSCPVETRYIYLSHTQQTQLFYAFGHYFNPVLICKHHMWDALSCKKKEKTRFTGSSRICSEYLSCYINSTEEQCFKLCSVISSRERENMNIGVVPV